MRHAILAALILLAGCGDSPTETAGPATVVLHSALAQPIYQGVRLTLDMENTGGPGGFKIIATFTTSRVNEPGPTVESPIYPVAAGWRETMVFEVGAGNESIHRIVVYSHSEGSLQFRETARHTFECCI